MSLAGIRLLMTADAVGGVWTYALDLARALVPRGIATTLALLGPPLGAEARAEARAIRDVDLIETGLPLDWLAPDEAEVRRAARAIAALARKARADLVQINQPALAAEPMPVPVVAVLHSCVATWWHAVGEGAMPADFVWRTRLVEEGLRRAARVACPSAAFARAARRAYRLPRAPAVIHNGRAPLNLPDAATRDFAFTAGRLWDRGKNIATLDRAAARLAVPFKAAGAARGPSGETIALDHIHPLGSIDAAELARQLAARPVFASAARYEPFGLAVLEAAQAGCALVLADIAGFRELWRDAATFVPADDAAGFAHAIQELIGDPLLRHARGVAARDRAARFTPAAMAAAMTRLHGEALGERRVAA